MLLNITGSKDITLFEVDAVTNRIRAEIDQDDEAEFIIGTTIDDAMGDTLKVSIVATGLTQQSGTFVRQPVKPRVQRPFMDDNSQDITEIAFEEDAPEEEIPGEEDLNNNEDIVIPVSLFSSNLEEDDDEEETPLDEESLVAETSEEDILKISENGDVTRPNEDAIPSIPEEEPPTDLVDEKQEKEGGFLNRLMKSKKDEVEEEEDIAPKQEDFSDVDLPDFLQK